MAERISKSESGMDRRYFARELARAAALVVSDPRSGYRRTLRGVGIIRAAILFRSCECGELVNAMGHVRVMAEGKIRMGDRVQLAGGMIPTELLCWEGAELVVGAHTLLSYGVSVEAHASVRIGERCMFGSMARIRDGGGGAKSAPVVIGDDVWVAHGAIIEPGVTIGAGSVVSAGSVVRDDVPACSLAVGNPAISVHLRGARAAERPTAGPP
jgi:maltose O-acetyltransferase